MIPKRILMFHPTHKTAVKSITDLFPETEFDFVSVPELITGRHEVMWSDEKLYPSGKNVNITGRTWKEVDERNYDVYISWPGMAGYVRRQWQIPGILMFMNAHDTFIAGFDWYVANTFSTLDGLSHVRNCSLIFPTIGRRAVGDWAGGSSGAYFLDDTTVNLRSGLDFDRAFLDFLSLRVPFSRVAGLLPRDEYLEYRRRMTVYIELSNRKISCALLESMMMGQPVIAPDANDWNRIITNGRNGLLYRDRDEAADMVTSVIDDEEFARRLGSEGRKRAEELAGDDIRRAGWEKAFERVMG